MVCILGVLLLASPALHAQDFLQKAKNYLDAGECEKAQKAYNAYKVEHPAGNAEVARRIAECGKATPARDNSKTDLTFKVGDVSFKMVFVEGGTFTMGCTSEQGGDCDDDEKTYHNVMLGDYYIGEAEVTVGLFREFISETGYRTDAEKEGWARRWMQVDGEWKWNKVNGINWMCDANGNVRNTSEDNHPVLYVSWNDAEEFCKWLSRKMDKTFSLPTEAQWEYAARGGNRSNGYKYAGSDNINDVAWYGNRGGTADGKTHPVKSKKANELGLYDMSGNVWEWCSDWYGSYSSSSQTDPRGPSSGSSRVLRGGGWCGGARRCRVSARDYGHPDYRDTGDGFRLAIGHR